MSKAPRPSESSSTIEIVWEISGANTRPTPSPLVLVMEEPSGRWGEIMEMWFELIDVLASRRYTIVMKANQKRATIYLDSELHRALRLKAAESDCSISALVNEAVRSKLAEDAEDLAAFEDRAHEPNLRFEAVLKDLRQRAKI